MTTVPQADLVIGEIDDTAPANSPKSYNLFARLGAEFVGTALLVFAIVGTALFGRLAAANGGYFVAIAAGLALTAGIAAFGGISGGHFNPAVTLGVALAGRFSWRDVLPYWLSQVLGGLFGTLVLFVAIPQGLAPLMSVENNRAFMLDAANGFGQHSPLYTLTASYTPVEVSWLVAALVEVVATALLVGVILGVTSRAGNSAIAPFAIGATLAIGIIISAVFTNAALNPARATATAIFGGDWALSQLWLFWVAPLFGGALAGLIARAFTPAAPTAAVVAVAAAPAAATWAETDDVDAAAAEELAEEQAAEEALAADDDDTVIEEIVIVADEPDEDTRKA